MKNIIITGSTRGVGLALAKEFLKANCNVTLSGRNSCISDAIKNDLKNYENQYCFIPCNVQMPIDIENLWEKSVEKWGNIDIWINNAGQNTTHAFCYETDISKIDNVINTNIKGMIYGSRTAAKNMLLQGSGQIWNMEGLGSNNMIQPKTILYGTTKHALTYFTKGLAQELKGTPVFAGRLSPGMMLTDFIIKTPEGETSPVIEDKKFKFIFNTLGDRPETVASFFVPRILKNTKNDAHIVWLTNMKSMARFISSPFVKRNLL